MLLSLIVLPNDYRVILFRGGVQAAGERENLERGHLPAVIGQDETTGPADGAKDIDDSGVRNGDDIASLKSDVVGSIAGLHKLAQINGDRVTQGRRLRRRYRVRGTICH